MTIRAMRKKAYHSARRFAWYVGGQKEHRPGGMAVPAGGFVSEEAALVFPHDIKRGEDVLLLAGARLICAGTPPDLEAAGSTEIGARSIIRDGAILHSYGGSVTLGKLASASYTFFMRIGLMK